MSDCFIRPLTVMEKNNEPDAKDAVLNEGTVQLLRFFLSERKKNDESENLSEPVRWYEQIREVGSEQLRTCIIKEKREK